MGAHTRRHRVDRGSHVVGTVREPLQLREHGCECGRQCPGQPVGRHYGGRPLGPLYGAYVVAVQPGKLSQSFLGQAALQPQPLHQRAEC